MPRARTHGIVEHDHGQRRNGRALLAQLVHFRNAFFQRTASQRDPQWIALEAARLVPKSVRAGVLFAWMADDAVVDLAQILLAIHPKIGQFEAVPHPAMLSRSDDCFLQVRGGPFNLHQVLVVERFRSDKRDPALDSLAAFRRGIHMDAPVTQHGQGLLNFFAERGGSAMRANPFRQRLLRGLRSLCQKLLVPQKRQDGVCETDLGISLRGNGCHQTLDFFIQQPKHGIVDLRLAEVLEDPRFQKVLLELKDFFQVQGLVRQAFDRGANVKQPGQEIAQHTGGVNQNLGSLGIGRSSVAEGFETGGKVWLGVGGELPERSVQVVQASRFVEVGEEESCNSERKIVPDSVIHVAALEV